MSVIPIEDCTLKIKPNATLVGFVKSKTKVTKDTPKNIIQLKNGSSKEVQNCMLLVKDIRWLNEQLIEYRKNSEDPIYLSDLLNKSNVILPQPKVLPRNPELDARVKKLIEQEKSRQYAAMTKDVDTFRKHHPEDTIAYQMNQINKQLIAVAQFVFSVITGFAFGFLGIELIVGNLDFGFRLLLGIMIALLVALAEIYFLAKKLNEDYIYETAAASSYKKVHQD